MSRRRAFRPACPDSLEGRIAPSLTAPHVQVHAEHATVKTSHTSTLQSAINSVKNVDWHKLETNFTNFLGFTHSPKPRATLSTPHTTSHPITR
jgi:hypothetical protein